MMMMMKMMMMMMMMVMMMMMMMIIPKKRARALSGAGVAAPLGASQDCGISLGLDSIASE